MNFQREWEQPETLRRYWPMEAVPRPIFFVQPTGTGQHYIWLGRLGTFPAEKWPAIDMIECYGRDQN